jgi:very-short-patch-repair endonuclease
MSTPVSSVPLALARWRSNLIDLTRRNPLLALRSARSTTLALSHPAPAALWQRLVQEKKASAFWLPPVDEDDDEEVGARSPDPATDKIQTRPGEIVCGDLGRRELLRTLTNLYRRAGAEYRERGLHILHVAFGVLEWRDQDNTESLRSPLVLLPVELVRASLREPFRLEPSEEDPVINPALVERLQQDFAFQLPAAPEEWDESEVADWLKHVETAIAGLPGWRVDTTALLSLFSFFKGVMYRDLEQHAEKAAAHPLVRALAGESVGDELTPTELPGEEELDAVQAPEKTFTILDADASQRLCLEAAARGHSFVLHGPPGTGKSQTIANLIADCLANGKKVLFVSEKMAALEVVYNRLRALGLGDYCLELHSHKASKRAVVGELKRCLEERRQPNKTAAEDFEKLRQRRDQLTRYVDALHQTREPLQKSVWWALGELTRCAGALIVAWSGDHATAQQVVPGSPDPATPDMTPHWFDDAQQAVQRAQQLWHIPEQGQDYPWWGFKVGDRYTLKLRDEVVSLLEKAKKQLDKLFQAADQYAAQIGARGSVAWLLRAGELLEASPRPPASWLTATDLPQLAADLETCAGLYKKRGQSREPLTQRYGPTLWSLPEGTAASVDQAWHKAAPLLAPGDDKGAGLLTRQQQLRGWAADTQKRIPVWQTEARTLEKWLDLTIPEGAGATSPLDTSPHWLKRLLRIAHLVASENAPEKAWVLDPHTCTNAQTLIQANRPVFAKFHETRTKLLQNYTEELFELELNRIAEGYAGPYQSFWRFFNMQYRRDRRAITRRTREHQLPSTVTEDIFAARDLMKEKTRLDSEQPARLAVLGRYEKGLATDFDAAERATRIAQEAVEIVEEVGHEELPEKFVEALSAAGPPPEKIRASIKRLVDSVGTWWHATEEIAEYLPVEALPGTGQPLDRSALSALLQYAKDLQAQLNQFAVLADPVLTRAKSQPPDAVTLVNDLREAELLQKQESLQETETAKWAERFGPGFHGMDTDWAVLRKALQWTIRVRDHFASAGPDWQPHPTDTKVPAVPAGNKGTPPAPFVTLATTPGGAAATKDLRHALEQFEHALHSFEIRFDPPAPLAGGKRLVALSLENCKKRLAELRDRAGELSDWIDWHHLGKRFEHLGLANFWTELQKVRPPRDQLVDAFLKSTLSGWVDRVFHEEPALGGFRRQEHERVLVEFRDLDRQLLRGNVQRVALAADARRPAAPQAIPGGEIAVLMREAHKKARHLPVRRLFEEIPDLLLQLKPCMLMSPLSVSQFLDPARVQFDLVVFDEASQIRPEDAIGAVLRGKQVVVTGDDKQLPPTDFFQQIADDIDEEDEDEAPAAFESVLDACLGAGLRPHFLRWHYRSRHEGLIAYSNHQFYDNRLITFPSAVVAGSGDPATPGAETVGARSPDRAPALGVHFHHVADGVYDRGGRRDNVREAQVVAEMVLKHFRDHGDTKTLGVIAFSQAQMFAIEDEIDRQLTAHPELEGYFKSDRLGGFFVKNLETVQGDERDVILLSVGYGRDASGKFALNFGPLNREGGQRRLNVAVTRAREKLVVVSSIRAADLDLSATKAEGVHHLHRYLDFAERGLPALETVAPVGGETQSPLETDVLGEVQKLGYKVVPQVGCSGYRIDLGVIDPKEPGRFLLGVECDGASYHATPTARDRDRLRQEVLEKLGWRLHRVWSTEWFQRRQQEIDRLREALEAAKKPLAAPRKEEPQPPPAPARKVEVGTPASAGDKLPGTTPYKVARLKVDKKAAKADLHAAKAQQELQRLVTQLAREEGPIHLDLAIKRLRQAWNLSRAGDKVREAVEGAAAAAEKRGDLQRKGEFLWSKNAVVVRVPDPKDAATVRDIEHIADEELQAGLRLLLTQGGAMDSDAILSQTARLFGFGKLGDTIKQRVQASVEALQQRGACVEKAGAIALV